MGNLTAIIRRIYLELQSFISWDDDGSLLCFDDSLYSIYFPIMWVQIVNMTTCTYYARPYIKFIIRLVIIIGIVVFSKSIQDQTIRWNALQMCTCVHASMHLLYFLSIVEMKVSLNRRVLRVIMKTNGSLISMLSQEVTSY